MKSITIVAALFLVGCGGAADTGALDRLRGYGLAGAGGEAVADLESASRPRRVAAIDEASPLIVEADGVVRELLPLVLARAGDPRADQMAARLRGLSPAHGWDDVTQTLTPFGVLADEWEPQLTPAELARFSTDANVARTAAAPTPHAAAVAALRSTASLVERLRNAGAPPEASATTTSRHHDLCPSEIADLAIAIGAPRQDVLDAVHQIARDVRAADSARTGAASPTPPCMPPTH